MNIYIGSTSEHKIEAVREACRLEAIIARVIGIKASSGQNEQPVGFEETYKGALARALEAQKQDNTCVSIGIESGIFPFETGRRVTLDMAVIVVLSPNTRGIVTTSSAIEFPDDCVQEAKKRGFDKTTVGAVIAEKLGGEADDPHSTLTNGRMTRSDTLIPALQLALRQVNWKRVA